MAASGRRRRRPSSASGAATPAGTTLEERLAQAQKTGGAELDLSNLDLSELPIQVLRMDQLVKLDLRENSLSRLPDKIADLRQLRMLILDKNSFSTIPSAVFELSELTILHIEANPLDRLPREIGVLHQLRTIWASFSPIRYVADEIGDLENLRSFWLGYGRLTEFPRGLIRCKNLDTLVLDGSKINKLPAEISHFTALRFLSLDDTGLSELPDVFSSFTSLDSLFLAGNRLSTLPPSMKSLEHLKTLALAGNPLPIPPEILTSEPPNILSFYFGNVTSSEPKIPLNEAKMVVVGQGGVGKTSLVKRIIGQPYDPNEDTTRGIWICPWDVERDQDGLKINIWDFGGQEIMHATHQFFLTARTLYVLVLDSRQGEQESRLEYWLKIIQSFGGSSPIIVVCNKADRNRLSLDETGLRRKYSSIVGFATSVSCETGEGIDDLRALVLGEIRKLNHLRDLFLTSWIAVKDELASMRDNERDYISFDEYEQICIRNGIDDLSAAKR
jgi:internalin A